MSLSIKYMGLLSSNLADSQGVLVKHTWHLSPHSCDSVILSYLIFDGVMLVNYIRWVWVRVNQAQC